MTHWVYRWLMLVPGLAVLSCGEPQVPPPPQAPRAAPAPPSAPAVKPGAVTRMPLESYFPLQQGGSALTFDVRPAIFYHFGHIPGAVSWPKGSYASQLAAHEEELQAASQAKRPVILYCTNRACPDANTIAQRLAARGHSVAILEGGYEEWKAAEMPTE